MKILIADSGSTKCDWMVIDEEGSALSEFHTMGFNPYFHNADLVESKMRETNEAMALALCSARPLCVFWQTFQRILNVSQRFLSVLGTPSEHL